MRLFVFVLGASLLPLATGCSDGKAPPALDASAVVDGGTRDLPLPLDGAGPDGAGCRTACDCPTGERCNQGVCETVVPMVFCCGTTACTGNNLCQSPNGDVSQCSLPPDAGVMPDGGSKTGCKTTTCVPGLPGDLFCTVACGSMNANCVAASAGSSAHCMP